jgi:hypothetical protein
VQVLLFIEKIIHLNQIIIRVGLVVIEELVGKHRGQVQVKALKIEGQLMKVVNASLTYF